MSFENDEYSIDTILSLKSRVKSSIDKEGKSIYKKDRNYRISAICRVPQMKYT